MRVPAFVLTLLVAVPALASEWEQRLDAFSTKTLAERKKLGLDRLPPEQARQRFPTPEVHFEGPPATEGGVIVICPGEAKPLALAGTLPVGAFVTPTTDDVQVSKEKGTAGHWSGLLTAKKASAPHTFSVRAAIPLSSQTTDAWGLVIGCRFTLVLTVEDSTLTIKADIKGQTQPVTGEWKKGGKPLGTKSYELALEGTGFNLQVQLTDEEVQRRTDIFIEGMKSPKAVALTERSQKILEKMGQCSSLPSDKMAACYAGPQAEMEKLSKDQEALNAAFDVESSPRFGCDQLRVDTTGENTAKECAGRRKEDQLPLKATWTSP